VALLINQKAVIIGKRCKFIGPEITKFCYVFIIIHFFGATLCISILKRAFTPYGLTINFLDS
jgi:hypothetical protein